MVEFEKLYQKALEDGILPGYALLAGDKDGGWLQHPNKVNRDLIA